MRGNKLFLLMIWGVFLVAILFRFWELVKYPVSLTMDEVAIGYGSFSLLKTGKDEWGNPMPLAFYSVGDYKPPVNYYLLVPSIAFFGLNEWSERSPVALLGAMSAVVFIILLRRLGIGRIGAIAGGMWLAISPWHVHFSRFGIEAVTGVFLLLVGITLFLYAIDKKQINYLLGAIVFFGLAVWAYHSDRIFVPLLLFTLGLLKFKELIFVWISKRNLILVIITGLVVMGPFGYLLISSPAIAQRAAMTSILREQSLMKVLHYGKYYFPGEIVFKNDLYLVFHHWLGKYLNYFDIQFWFWKGMGFTPPGYADSGLMYLWDFGLMGMGVVALLKSKNVFLKMLALFWFLAGPLAASFTMNEQHTLRSLVWLPVWGIIYAYGVNWFLVSRFNWRKIVFGGYIILLGFNIGYVKDLYTVQMPKFFSEYWGYGYKQAAVYACENKDKYDRIIIGSVYGSEGPLMTGIPDYYVMFYCQYDPIKYIATHRLEKFDFGRVDWHSELRNGLNSLLISARWDYPLVTAPEEYVIKKMDYLNDKPAFYYVTTKKQK